MAEFIDWKEHRKKLRRDLTDNVKVNVLLSPVYFAIVSFFLFKEFNYPLYSPFFDSAFFYGFISSLVYIYASHYYQPDLDIHVTRPGMGHFPLGRTIGSFKIGRFLKWFFYPINRFWYYMWHPYGRLLTHRGIGHFPVIGVLIRTGYLLLLLYGAKFLVGQGPLAGAFFVIERWLMAFIPFTPDFWTEYFFLWCFPVYLSDFFHALVDYYDSARKGISFCPPKIPRGLLAKTWLTIKDIF